MENLYYGGHTSQEEISSIMQSNAKKYTLRYSHTKENRWNLWLYNSGATLSFILNNGLFIPSISGIVTETLDKFYSTCPADVDQWVKADINKYLKLVNKALTEEDQRREVEAYEAYLSSYYADMQAIDEANEAKEQELRNKETDCQRYNRENDTFYTEEEYRMMFPEDSDILYEAEEAKQLVKRLKPRKRKSKEVPGQMSLFDYSEGGNNNE